jgi:hypothetical protein
MLVIAFHEFGHAITCVLTGGHVKSISLDPREGGVTHMQGGRNALTLPAGYLGSSLIGALLTFAGFNINASKIASIVVGVCFLLTLWWGRRDWLTIGTVLAAVGLLVGCWFIAHAEALRFVVLFIGVMSSLYSVWDIVSYLDPLFPCVVAMLCLGVIGADGTISATISSCARSTAPMRACLPSATAARPSAGASSGPLSRWDSWPAASSRGSRPSRSPRRNRGRTRSILSPPSSKGYCFSALVFWFNMVIKAGMGGI